MMHKYEGYAKVAVVGARGYAGLELSRLLLSHPRAKLSACFSADRAFRLADHLPEVSAAAAVETLPMEELAHPAHRHSVVFLAIPAEVSLELAPRLLDAGIHVIDLSGAFRLASGSGEDVRASYLQWYGFEHSRPDLLARAHYGLVPWAGPLSGAAGACLIANPGCYATSVLMGVLPLLKQGLIDPASLVIDAKSGASGAGRKAAENLLFTEVDGECLPYKVGKHQHWPEIREYAARWGGGVELDFHFTTSLLGARRGIISGIYARVRDGVGLEQVSAAYERAYSGYPLARHGVLDASRPGPSLASLKRVAGSARTQISYQLEGGKLYVFSVIDNLMKGAASQAVENFNRIHDCPVHTALIESEVVQ